ncbi:MAG TPA: FecR family protein [Actinomycetota bacterium]|jgi:hypothetical protein|nr:FecR family protein [Actinomycetota bacterium]
MSTDELTRFATYKEDPRRPKIGVIAGLTALVLFGVILLIVLSQRDKPALAELRIRDSEVEVEKRGARSRAAVEGEALAAGDTVRTDANGQAQIDYFTGTVTRLDSTTTFVVDALLNSRSSKRISLKLDVGRSWNRVEGLSSSEDRFDVQMPNAIATVRGTTNVTDCRQAPVCYVLGFVDDTEIVNPEGDRVVAGPDDCYRVDEAGIRECTDHERRTLFDDSWLDEMRGLDALAAYKTPPPTASASPSFVPRPRTGIRRSTVTPSPVPEPARTRRPRHTDDPNETEEPTTKPKPSPPTPEPPTEQPTPCQTPPDCPP